MNYKTIASGGQAEYEIQRSRFIAAAAPVETEEAAQEFIRQQKKKYFDARHNCSAYIIGETSSKQKSSDDGEPGGTAGMPILECIKKNELTNIVIVVTRYFGGIKLGAGGLIRAYSHAASLAIGASELVEAKEFWRTALTIGYDQLGMTENWLRQNNIRTADKDFAADITLHLLLPKTEAEQISEGLIDLTAGKGKISKEELVFLQVPLKQ